MKAMIFAAGLGTRLKPLTDRMPKALVPVGGRPLLEHVILRLREAGVEEIIVNVHHFPDQIIDFLQSRRNFDIRIEVSDERDRLLDTGGGVRRAAAFFDDGQPFFVHNVDILSDLDLRALYDYHFHQGGLATLVVSRRDTARYLLFDPAHRLHGWTNIQTGEVRPAGLTHAETYERLAFSGIQVLSPEVFALMEGCGEKFPIMDFYLTHAAAQRIYGYMPTDYHMLDVGKLHILDAAEEFVKTQKV